MEDALATSVLHECLLAAKETIIGSVPFTIGHGDRGTAAVLARLSLATQHMALGRTPVTEGSTISVPGPSSALAGSAAAAARERKHQIQLLHPSVADASEGAAAAAYPWVWKVDGLGTVAVFLGCQELDAAWLSPESHPEANQASTSQVAAGVDVGSNTRRALVDTFHNNLDKVLGCDMQGALYFAGHGSGGALAQAAFVHLLANGSPALVTALLAGGLYTYGALLALTKEDLAAYAAVDTPDLFSAAELLEVVVYKARKRAGNGTGASKLMCVHQFVNGLDVHPRLLGGACQQHMVALDALAGDNVRLRQALQECSNRYCFSFEPIGTYHLLLCGEVRSANSSSHPELCKLLLEQPLASLAGGLVDAVLCEEAASQAASQHGMASYQQALCARQEALTPQLFMGGTPDDYQVVYGWPHGHTSAQPVGFLQHRPTGIIAYNAFVPSQGQAQQPASSSQASSGLGTQLMHGFLGGVAEGAGEAVGQQIMEQTMGALFSQTAQQGSSALLCHAGGAAANIAAGGAMLGPLAAVLPIANTVLGFLNLGASIYTAVNTHTIKKKVKHIEQDLRMVMEQNHGLAQGMDAVLLNQEQLARMTHTGLLHLDARFGKLDSMLGHGLATVQGQMQRMELGIQDRLQGLGTQLGTGLLHLDNKLSVLGFGLKLALDDHSRLMQTLMTGMQARQEAGFGLLHQEVAGIGRTLQTLPEDVSREWHDAALKTDWNALQEHYLATLEALEHQEGTSREVPRMYADSLKAKAIDVRARVETMLDRLHVATSATDLLKRLPLLERTAIAGAMLDLAQSVLLNKEEYLNNRLKAVAMIDQELQQWISLSTLYSMATIHQEATIRLVCLRRAMLEPAQLTVSLCPEAHPGQQQSPLFSTVAYNMQDLVWDDGLDLIRQLVARREPVPQDERLPHDEIAISDLQLAAAYAALRGTPSWGTSFTKVTTSDLLDSLGVPRDQRTAVLQHLRKSDAAALMMAASSSFKRLVVANMARQLPGTSILRDMGGDEGCSIASPAFRGSRNTAPPRLQRTTSLTMPVPAARHQPSPTCILDWQAHEEQRVALTWMHANAGLSSGGSSSGSGRLLATASQGPAEGIRIWRLPDVWSTAGTAVTQPEFEKGPAVAGGASVALLRCLSLQPGSSDGTTALLAAGGERHSAAAATAVELWRWGGQCWELHKKFRFGATVNSCAWSPDGQLLAVLTNAGLVAVRDVAQPPRRKACDALWGEAGKEERGFSLSWSEDGQLLAWGAKGGRVFLHDVGSQSKSVAELQGADKARVSAVAWGPATGSPQARLLLTGGHDGKLRVWTIGEGLQQRGNAPVVLQQHTAQVQAVAWRPGATQQVASVSVDGMVLLWDARDWKVVGEHQLDQGWVTSMSWSPDGRVLAVGKRNGRVSTLMYS